MILIWWLRKRPQFRESITAAWWLECLPMVWETWVQSQVESYQRLKKKKMLLDASLLKTQHYKVQIKGKMEQSRERSCVLPTPWCSSYRKGELLGHLRLRSPTTFITAALVNVPILIDTMEWFYCSNFIETCTGKE